MQFVAHKPQIRHKTQQSRNVFFFNSSLMQQIDRHENNDRNLALGTINLMYNHIYMYMYLYVYECFKYTYIYTQIWGVIGITYARAN